MALPIKFNFTLFNRKIDFSFSKMKTWVIKIGTSILRGTEDISTEEVIETLCNHLQTLF